MNKLIVFGGCGCVNLIVGIILLCVSFQYVDYNQYALKRNTLTNKVYTDKIYENGRYIFGPSVDMIYFERDYQKKIRQ